jgi:prevent-host-death family protein
MIEISVSEAKSAFSEYLNRAAYGQEPVVILSRGKPKAAVISIEALRR